jgi:hypothetical protein
MKTFKNTSADTESESTVILFAVAEYTPTSYGVWVECSDEDLEESSAMGQLFIEAGVRYYGYL